MVLQAKWKKVNPNYRVGDVVQVSDSNSLRRQYFIAQIAATHPDKDGIVRRVSLRYKNHKVGGNVRLYTGAPDTVITRSVQRIAPLVDVDAE